MSVRDFLVISAVGGGLIGLCGLLTQTKSWKSFLSIMWNWKGTTVACLTALVGVCIVSGKPIVQLFRTPQQQVFLLEVVPKPEL